MAKVTKTPTCWLWIAGSRGKTGYGAFKYNGKVVDSHRVSYMIYKGEIPQGMYVCHSCDNRKCVNPNHLFLGTAKDNYDDAVGKGRIVKTTNEKLKKHPSRSAYGRGCRCAECKNVVKEASRKYRDSIKKRLRDAYPK